MPTPGSLHPSPALPLHLASPPRQASSASVTVLGLPLSSASRVLAGKSNWRRTSELKLPSYGSNMRNRGIVEGNIYGKCFGTVLKVEVKSVYWISERKR